MCNFYFTFICVPVEERKSKKKETKECELKVINDVIKKILAETEEQNLDNLVRDFLQSKWSLKMIDSVFIIYFYEICLFP